MAAASDGCRTQASSRLAATCKPGRTSAAQARTCAGSVLATRISPSVLPRAAEITDAQVRPQRPPPMTTSGSGRLAASHSVAKSIAAVSTSLGRFGGTEIVLRTERQMPKRPIDRRQHAADWRYRKDGARSDVGKTSLLEHGAQPPWPQQHRVLVDLAGLHDVLGRRIVGIMFEDEGKPARPQHAIHVGGE